MAEWPKSYNPARYDRDANYLVTTDVTAQGWQLRPDTWIALAIWCGAARTLDGNGNQALQLGTDLVHLGDFVMLKGGVFHVEPADGHYQRWAAV